MTIRNLLTRLVSALDAFEIPYMLTGSYASSIHSIPRATRDLDIINVIDYGTGWKVDFIIPPFSEFNLEEFERRKTVEFDGMQLSVVSPEDIVVAKLLWAKAGESEIQLNDAASVVRVQRDKFDIEYVEQWVKRLGLAEQWATVRRRAKAP